MVDDVTIAIAAAVAGKVGESLAEGTKETLKKLRTVVFERFRDDPAAHRALSEAQIDTEDAAAVRELAGHLHSAESEDPGIQRLVEQLRPEFGADRGAVHNTVSGSVHGNVVQAGDINGDLNLGR